MSDPERVRVVEDAPLVPVQQDDGADNLTLAWRNITAFVGGAAGSKAARRVLHDASGEARPSEILAVMGPSGAGKTTLLNILAARPALGKRGEWRGDVTINGLAPPPAWKRMAAYAMQKDIFFERLTVEEHLRCTAMLKLPPHMGEAEKLAEMSRVVSQLGLDKALRTCVGSGTERGLSGGELKRLNIATELLSRPKLLFLDEPFTGLDSTLAMSTLEAIREIASSKGVTVMLTVHQPSSAMWSAFDSLLLMAPGGHVAFHGPRTDATAHFARQRQPVKDGWSVADHLIDVVTSEQLRPAAIAAWAEAESSLTSDPVPVGVPLSVRPQPLFGISVSALLRRQRKLVLRVALKPIEWALTVLLAATFGMLFWQVGAHRREVQRQQDYISVIFFFVAQWSWAPLFQVLGSFPAEREVLTRERASDSYSVQSWYVSKLMAEWPLSWLMPAAFFVVLYPLAALPAAQAPLVFSIILLNVEVSTSLGGLLGAMLFDREKATVVAIVYMVYVMCAGGFFVNLNNLPPWLGWVRFTSFWYYSMGLVVAAALPTAADRDAFTMPINGSGTSCGTAGSSTLDNYSFSKSAWDGHWELEVSVLAALAVTQRLLTLVVLRTSKALQFS